MAQIFQDFSIHVSKLFFGGATVSFKVRVYNKKGYGRELQLYQSYSYVVIPANGYKDFKNVSEEAIRAYEKCEFEVEKITSDMQKLNEVPVLPEEKKREEVIVSKEADNLQPLREVGIKNEKENNSSKMLTEKLKTFDVEMLRALLVDVGVNPRNTKDKNKLIEMTLKQDRKKVENLLQYSE